MRQSREVKQLKLALVSLVTTGEKTSRNLDIKSALFSYLYARSIHKRVNEQFSSPQVFGAQFSCLHTDIWCHLISVQAMGCM